MKVKKHVLPRTMEEHINIRLKLVMGNLVILVGLGFKVGWNQYGICVLYCRSTTRSMCSPIDRSIIAFAHRSIVIVDGQLRVFIILFRKCTKINTLLQITPKPKNILKGLQNNYKVFKNTCIPWLKWVNPCYVNFCSLLCT